MHIIECTVNKSFTDVCKFPLAKLYGIHKIEILLEGLKLTTTIIVKGLLSWFWSKVVAKDIVATLLHQTGLLVNIARKESCIS